MILHNKQQGYFHSLCKHVEDTGGEHGNDVPNFTMNVTGVFGDDVMLRQITEAVLISKTQSSKLINNKNKWNYVSNPRAVINYE
jgi:hypothetical protein